MIKIVTGDTILVKTKSGVERKLQLASVKQAPRGVGSTAPGGSNKSRDIKEVGYQFEAREFLRKKLIGKTVSLGYMYKRISYYYCQKEDNIFVFFFKKKRRKEKKN